MLTGDPFTVPSKHSVPISNRTYYPPVEFGVVLP